MYLRFAMITNEIIERGTGLSDLLLQHNSRTGIGRAFARFNFRAWLMRRRLRRSADYIRSVSFTGFRH